MLRNYNVLTICQTLKILCNVAELISSVIFIELWGGGDTRLSCVVCTNSFRVGVGGVSMSTAFS